MEKLAYLLCCVLALSRATECSVFVPNGIGSVSLEQLTERFPALWMLSEKNLADNRNSCTFFCEVFDFFASYEVQKDITIYNVADLSDWGQSNKPQGLRVNNTNFIEFVKLIPSITVNLPSPPLSKLEELNEIINFTLASPPQFECKNDTMIVNGNFLKSSDIQPSTCASNSVSKINIIASDTFYVDNDLKLNGYKEVNILADKWEIVQSASFNLKGIDGKEQAPPNTEGTTGKSGNAGTNAGNFFGYANKLINGHLLSVNLIGGNGAKGQDGTASKGVAVSFNSRSHKESGNYFYKIEYEELSLFYKNYLQNQGYVVEYIGSLPIQHPFYKVGSTAFVGIFVHKYILHPKYCCGPTGKGGFGGLGGKPGNFTFIYTGDNKNVSIPKFYAINGSQGSKGKDAVPCKSSALEIRASGVRHTKVLWGTHMYALDTYLGAENSIKSNRC